jgi:hypothetical protein
LRGSINKQSVYLPVMCLTGGVNGEQARMAERCLFKSNLDDRLSRQSD